MSRLDIVKSSTEPNIENLWLDRDKLKFYDPKGWTTLTGGVQDPAPVQPSPGIKKKVIELSEDAFVNLITDGKIVISDVDMSEPYDSVVLKIGDIEYACYKSIIVDNTVKYTFIDVNTTTRSGSDIETETFLNKELTAVVLTYPIGGRSLSAMTESIDTNKEFVYLEIGTSTDVKKENLNKINSLESRHFPVHIDYGFGVGTYQSSTGGFAHVTTAYGNEVFYDINKDGSVIKNEVYVKPNEPYTVMLAASQVGVPLDDATSSHIVNCGEIVITGSTGPITYTRTSDSTTSNIYFTDDRKDGKITMLTYNINTKTVSSNIVNPIVPAATTTVIGGIKQVPDIADIVVDSANAEILAGKINDLLAALRSAGILTQ